MSDRPHGTWSRRRWLTTCGAVLALPVGCTTKAQKQAELAVEDVTRLGDLMVSHHVKSLERALPPAGQAISSRLGGKEVDTMGDALSSIAREVVLKSEDLRSTRRSYYAITNRQGEILWVEDEVWNVVGRRMSGTFPPVRSALEGQAYARGSGRFGGASDEALSFVSAVPLRDAGTIVGSLVAVWEAHDAAEDLQRQRVTELRMKKAPAKVHTKAKDRLALDVSEPDVWIALVRGPHVYLREDAPQPLEEAVRAYGLGAKIASGSYRGTITVMNKDWGVAARLVPDFEGVGIASFRLDP